MDIEHTTTPRGFEVATLRGLRRGGRIALQQSSAIDGQAKGGIDLPGSSFVWIDLGGPDAVNPERACLTGAEAVALAELLTRWARTGNFREGGE